MKHTLSTLVILFAFLPFLNAQTIPESSYEGLDFRNIGPFRGGRSAAVTGVPDQPNLFYFGAAGGGVWRTEDAGKTWENISDGYFGGSIGAVAVSEYDPNVIYVGGGEKTVRGNVSYGYGMWKTTDAGKTWEQIGLKNSRHISRVRIHPKNPDLVYAAVMGDLFKPTQERGVYRSKDGGKNWERILFANADAGAVDLILDPMNPRVLYASTWRIRRTPYSLSSGGEGSALWKSTDGGDNWTEITRNEGLPKGVWGINAVAVSPVKRDRVWVLVENKDGGVFRSDDGGETWMKVNDSRALRQRAWYYTRIYADTKDENTVYVVNVDYQKSIDGGRTFKAARAPHGDHHDLWIAPEDPSRMIMGDDGGAQVSLDGGKTWSTYQNQPTAQFYRVTTDNHFPYRIYAAQQDNSTVRIAHRSTGSTISTRDWEATAGGESAHIAPHPENPEIVFAGSYGGFLTRYNHDTEESHAINVWPDNPMGYGAEGMKYRFQWNFPVFFSPHNPDKLYVTSNHVHASTDGGRSWETISPDLTRNDSSKLVSSGGPITQDNTSVEYYCTIFAAAESQHEEGVIWAGSDDGLLHLTRDGGENWTNVTPKNLPEWTMINSIEVDPHEKGGLYVAATRYKLGDYAPYLYKTTDYGKTWTKITEGIQDDHFTRVVRADPEQKGLLYVGTESGLYISFNDGKKWQKFQQNVPIVPITDMTIKEKNLIVATQGRSLWVLDDLTPLHKIAESESVPSAQLFPPLDSYRMDGRQLKEPSKTAGTNHPGGVMVYFYLSEKPDTATDLSFTFLETDGDTIRTFGTKVTEKALKIDLKTLKKGINRFVWDMRYAPAHKVDGMILWWAGLGGPKAIPADYQVSMQLDGMKVGTENFKIVANPKSEATQEDMEAQFTFLVNVRDKVTETHKTIENIRKVCAQVQDFLKRAEDEEIQTQGKAIVEKLTEVEKALYQTKNRSRQDPLNFPIKLGNKLAHLTSLVSMGDFAPTKQAEEFRKEVTAAIDAELAKYQEVMDKEIPAFNKLVREKEVPAVSGE
ncbi:MAG: glycosyl hydrolase [Bacteroidota bacterium]